MPNSERHRHLDVQELPVTRHGPRETVELRSRWWRDLIDFAFVVKLEVISVYIQTLTQTHTRI